MDDLMGTVATEVARQLRQAARSTRALVRRVTFGTTASSSFSAQLRGIDGENWEGAEVWHPHGLTSRPAAGTEGLAVEPEGSGEGAIVIATANRDQEPSTAVKETVLWADQASGGTQTTLRAQHDRWIFEASGATPAKITGYDSGKIEVEAGSGGKLTMTAGGSVTLESTPGNPCHIGGDVTSEKLIMGESFNSHTTPLFTTVAGSWVSLSAAWTAVVAFAAAVQTATGTLNGSGPPITTVHLTTWANAVNTAIQTLGAAVSPAATASLGAQAAGNAIASWYNGLAGQLTTRAKGQ